MGGLDPWRGGGGMKMKVAAALVQYIPESLVILCNCPCGMCGWMECCGILCSYRLCICPHDSGSKAPPCLEPPCLEPPQALHADAFCWPSFASEELEHDLTGRGGCIVTAVVYYGGCSMVDVVW